MSFRSNAWIASFRTRFSVLLMKIVPFLKSTSHQVSARISPLRREPANARWTAIPSSENPLFCNNLLISSLDNIFIGQGNAFGSVALWNGLRSAYSQSTACSNALCSNLWTEDNICGVMFRSFLILLYSAAIVFGLNSVSFMSPKAGRMWFWISATWLVYVE